MKEISKNLLYPRRNIQTLLQKKETSTVLEMAGMLHGHYCPGLALGVKAVACGFERLGITDNEGMEEIMAVVECNNCFVDGIQFAAGCSLGNNALVYKDLGKTAVTFFQRGSAHAVRFCVTSFDTHEGEEQRKEGDALFEKAVKRREKLTDIESRRFKELWIQRSFSTIAMPVDELFTITECPAPQIPFAPIVESKQCSMCGESVMETQAGLRMGAPLCRTCSQQEFSMVLGKGIVTGNVLTV